MDGCCGAADGSQLRRRVLQETKRCLTSGSEYSLGQKIAALLQVQMASHLPDNAMLGQVHDLVGSDPALLLPLRDLLQRPAYRQLHDPAAGPLSHSQLLAGRDGLLQDLALTYQPAVVARLAAVIDGSLGLLPGPPPIPQAARATMLPPPPPAPPSPAWPAPPVPDPAPSGSGPGTLTVLLIALVSLLSGAVLLALGWLLFSGRPQVSGGVTPATPSIPAASPSPQPAPAPSPTPTGSAPSPSPSPSSGAWGRASDYKFGQLPGGDYPDSCAFSLTDANGRTTTDTSQIEYWACRDVGGDPDRGYRVVWADGKETTYTFAADGNGTVVGTNGSSYPMRWRNDSHQGREIIVIHHQDGAMSWIPGNIRAPQE